MGRRLVGDGDSQVSRVVREHVVIDAEIQTAVVTSAERSRVRTDEEDLIAIADAANECSGRTIGKRAVGVERGVALAIGAVLAVASPSSFTLRSEVDLLTRADVNPRVGPLLARIDDDLALAHAARNTSRFVAILVALSAIELDPIDFIARNADGSSPATAAIFELDFTTVHTEQLALHTPAISQHKRIGVHQRGGCDERKTCKRETQLHGRSSGPIIGMTSAGRQPFRRHSDRATLKLCKPNA